MIAQEEIDEFGQELEALEGADLRPLGTFISGNDKYKVLGNLYRIVTENEHVKWVYLSHYHTDYMEAAEKRFRDIVRIQSGDYDEHFGEVVLTLKSAILVEKFPDTIVHAKQIQELDVRFQYKWQSCVISKIALSNSRNGTIRLKNLN
ncbi:hypothetical protein K7432_007504 [Basidiobolus ranarum]|uniref:Uncharacterized protein n=1 Tax=Basidiobolus ranarum TaxID=34480 RepID=A0ABR2VZZ7_9FUNG